MPRKEPKYKRAAVIEAGLKQLEESGWEGITPKSVAKKLGASTMPIFSHFASMKEFKKAILDRAWEMQLEYASANYTGDTWIDQGIGYVLFARDHGKIFNCMYYGELEEIRNRRLHQWELLSKLLIGHPTFEGLSAEHVEWIRYTRSLLIYGIAVSVSSGFGPVWNNEEVIRRMVSMYSEILLEGLSKRGGELDEITKISPPEVRKILSKIKKS